MSFIQLFENSVTRKLVMAFYKGSLQYSLQLEDVDLFTWEEQEKFIEATINSEIVKKYPIHSDFARLFFKKLLNYLEFRQEVHDVIYSYLCTLMEKVCEKEKFCYRHYIVHNNLKDIITIKETNNMVFNGTTGLRTWEAAQKLADWVLSNENLFNNKKILELGSGVGFTGITVAKFCDIESIVMTDCHEDVLKALSDNIEINFPQIKRAKDTIKSEFTVGKKVLGVMKLDWDECRDLPHDLVPDVIIGSDIIYDPSILKPLCSVIKKFMSRNKNLEAYVANVIRNENTYKLFLETLGEFQFDFKEISHTTNAFVDWDVNINMCLLKINNTK